METILYGVWESAGVVFIFTPITIIGFWVGESGRFIPFVLLGLGGFGLDMRICWCFGGCLERN